jgi:hypothetical protein
MRREEVGELVGAEDGPHASIEFGQQRRKLRWDRKAVGKNTP